MVASEWQQRHADEDKEKSAKWKAGKEAQKQKEESVKEEEGKK